MFTVTPMVAQSKQIQDLELQVYSLNNQFKYTASQNLIKQFIQKPTNSNEDLVYAYIIWSYTYKRLYDYATTLAKLEEAKIYAQKSNHKKQLTDIVNTEFAFALFDTQQYKKSLHLMQDLKSKNFKYNSAENKAKLLMQMAYIAYLDKQYYKSEATYQNAIALLKKSRPCDLPIIYTKMMNLYDETNQPNKLQESLKKSLYYADSCNIVKYNIYTYEEYDKILKKNKNIKESFKINKIIGRLKNEYNSNENLGKLHLKNYQDTVAKEEKEKEKIKTEKNVFGVLSVIFILIVFLISILLFIYQKNNNKLQQKTNFYTEKYNTLWSSHQLSLQQFKKLKEELLKQEEAGVKHLVKDISLHLSTNANDDHRYINTLKDNFIEVLQEKAPYLNSTELLICFFINLNLPHKEIGDLLNKSKKSIDSYKYRINAKIKQEQGLSTDKLFSSVRSVINKTQID